MRRDWIGQGGIRRVHSFRRPPASGSSTSEGSRAARAVDIKGSDEAHMHDLRRYPTNRLPLLYFHRCARVRRGGCARDLRVVAFRQRCLGKPQMPMLSIDLSSADARGPGFGESSRFGFAAPSRCVAIS
jgi:hypothetical protein